MYFTNYLSIPGCPVLDIRRNHRIPSIYLSFSRFPHRILVKSRIPKIPFQTLITWGQAAKSNLLKILILQKRALRLMHFFPNRDHILPLFISFNILPINLLYFETALIFMHDVAHDSVPLNLKNLFRSSNQVHSYNTRFSSAGNYYVNSSRTNVMRNSISRLGPNLWNSLNNTTRELPRKSFKTKVHNMLLSFLASEDIYIESPSVIQKLISKSVHNDG